MSLPQATKAAQANDNVHLVAPTPRYASANPLSQQSSNRSGQSNNSDLQIRSPEAEKASQSASEYLAILPQLGQIEDAQAAIDKLERIQRARAQKRRWRKGTGYAGLEVVATAGGRKAKRDLSKEKKNAQQPQHDKDDADSVASSLNLYGEVRLAITNMPGFNVLGSKSARNKMDRSDSPAQDGEVPERHHTFRFGSLTSRRQKTNLGPTIEQMSSGTPLVTAQTDGVADAPSSIAPDPEGFIAESAKPLLAKPDLQTLQEERKIEEATDALTNETPPNQVELVKPKAERPKLMLQSPSMVKRDDDAEQEQMAMMQSPEQLVPPPNIFKEDRASPRIYSDSSSPLSHTPSPGPSDGHALAAAEQCRRNLSRPTLLDEQILDDYVASVNSPSSNGSGSESDSESESDTEAGEANYSSVNLHHGEELTRKQRKRMIRHIRRHKRKQIAQGEPVAGTDGSRAPSRTHQRKASLTNHISTGLHYASSQSRNRRAIEKYSPHPSRPSSTKPFAAGLGMTAVNATSSPPLPPTQMNGSVSRSSTPAALNSETSSLNNEEGVATTAGAEGTLPDEELWKQNDVGRHLLKRWATNQSTASSLAPSASIKGPSFRSRFLSLRRGTRQQPSDVAEEEAGSTTPKQEQDAEHELDKALGQLAIQEAPEELKDQYEYDVLYENQRGMLFFGIPKFSAKTLFQWDPAPWTNARSGNSAYNVVNAQLPNPSWEWVHPEWMIDMSGDVDEAGWQYSFNFGRFSLGILQRPGQAIPRAGAEGNAITNDRFQREVGDVDGRQHAREDDGLEALRRTALARQAKWTGIPDQNKYVRRRRWMRLRCKRAIATLPVSHTPKAGTPIGMSKTSNDWSQLVKSPNIANSKGSGTPDPGADDASDATLSDFEEGSSSSSDGHVMNAGESSFLPRRTYGNLHSGSNAMEARSSREQKRRRRHAREFTGTIRELKSLLPAIMDRRSARNHRSNTAKMDRQKALWLTEIDARNPFISWSYVKRRLDDDDLAFATTSLRARERRHAQKVLGRRERTGSRDGHSVLMSPPTSNWENFEMTRDALVEINFRRVLRVLRACKLDRQKLSLWRIWLNVEQINAEPSRNEDLIELGLAASRSAGTESLARSRDDLARIARSRWRNAFTPADAMDVWDLLERRLDRLLMTFEYQSSRTTLLRLLLTLHASSHANHRFRPTQMRMGEQVISSDVPDTLSPSNTAAGESNQQAAGDEWRSARVPRLEFWSDLIDCARSLVASPRGQPGGASMSTPNLNDLATFSSPTQATSAVVVPGLSYAMQPLSRSGTPVHRATSPPHSYAPTTSSILKPSSAGGGHVRRASSTVMSFGSGGVAFAQQESPAAAASPTRTGSPKVHERDRLLLAHLLQLPIERQQDVILQSCSSVFEGKSKADAHAVAEANAAKGEQDKHQEGEISSPFVESPTMTSLPFADLHAHERTDSELVQRLNEAIEKEEESGDRAGLTSDAELRHAEQCN